MGDRSISRTLYAIKLPSGQSIFCPMKDRPVLTSKCVKCEWNSDHRLSPLPPDELRGVGYVTCRYGSQ